MDNLVFEESVNAEIDQSEFISKKWIYVNDSNSQNYTSQVVIDSTPLSNAGGYINWSEGFIVMPLLIQLKGTDGNAATNLPANTKVADHCWAFKSGFWNMINSMTVEFNNQNIIQQTPFLNVFRSFKAHTSFSQDDLLNEGATIGYYPDTAGSWSFNNDPTIPAPVNATPSGSGGIGLCNNRQAPVMVATSPIVSGAGAAAVAFNTTTEYWGATAYGGLPSNSTGAAAGVLESDGATNPNPYAWSEYSANSGFAKRSDWYGYDPTNNSTGQGFINNAAGAEVVYRSHKLPATTAGFVTWAVYAKLRLKDLGDYFAKCPLLKGSTIRFYINTNQANTNFSILKGTIDAVGKVDAFNTLVVNDSTVLGGLTQPLMLASADIGQGCSPLPEGTYNLSVSIYRNTTSGASNPATSLQACRLYAPVYKMNPLAEQRYLSLAPTKKIEYNDIFQYQFNSLPAGGNFNILVTNGIQDIQSVLVVPFLSAGNSGNMTTFSTLLSPTCGSGGMPDPITLTNFNILVSGVNLFLNNEYYDFEQFNEELKSSNQLNGNLTTGLTSGLISEDMFSRAYRYYYGNCARILPSEAGVSRSIQIQGTNQSLKEINLMVFVEFKRSMTIDISTGARIE